MSDVSVGIVDTNECQFVLALDKQGEVYVNSQIPLRLMVNAIRTIADHLEQEADKQEVPPLADGRFN